MHLFEILFCLITLLTLFWLSVPQLFQNIPFLSPLASRLGVSGGIDPYRGQEINRAFVRGFFNPNLKGGSASYLYSENPDFPGIEYGTLNDVSQNDQ